MKKVLLAAFICISATASFACDICGCGGSNFYMGLLPGFRSKFAGIRYDYMNYNTRLKSDATQFSKNYYNTIEMWGGANIGNKVQLLAFVPYHINKQIDDDGLSNSNGMGDITLLASYQVLHKINTAGNKAGTEQRLWIGGGLKLPAGRFAADVKNPNTTIADVNAQLGTGTIDFLLNTMYNVRLGKWGINNTVSYKTNTAKQTYKYGNKLTANSIGYYRLKLNKTNLLPNAGLMYESTDRNSLAHQKIAATGGMIATVSAGAEMSIQNITIGINSYAPLFQNYADNQTKLDFRGSAHITFTL